MALDGVTLQVLKGQQREVPKGLCRLVADVLQSCGLLGDFKMELGNTVGGRRSKGLSVSKAQLQDSGRISLTVQAGRESAKYKATLYCQKGREEEIAGLVRAHVAKLKDPAKQRKAALAEAEPMGIVAKYSDTASIASALAGFIQYSPVEPGRHMLLREAVQAMKQGGLNEPGEEIGIYIRFLADKGYLDSDGTEDPMYRLGYRGRKLLARHRFGARDFEKLRAEKRAAEYLAIHEEMRRNAAAKLGIAEERQKLFEALERLDQCEQALDGSDIKLQKRLAEFAIA